MVTAYEARTCVLRHRSYGNRKLLGVAEAREELAKSKVKQTSMQEEVAALEKQLEERVAVLEKQLEELNEVCMCVASVSV